MNSQELRALQEAYSQVYELDEVKGIEGHINPNTGKSSYGLDSGLAMTPKKRMETRANSLQKKGEGKRANKIRAVMKRPSMEEAVDLYDIILSHLLDEGYADTEQAAEAIMVNMSEDWRESIVEATYKPSGSAAPTDIPSDTRMTVTAADKAGNTKAYQNFKAGDPAYKAASHLKGV